MLISLPSTRVDPLDATRSTPVPPLGTDASRFDEIAGMSGVKQRLGSIALSPTAAAWSGLAGAVRPGGILLHGPAGPAVPSLVRALAGELGVPFVVLDLAEWCDLDLGQAGIGILHVTGLDEVVDSGSDAVARLTRALDRQHRDGDPFRPLVVATSSAPWELDTALFDTGRLDRLVFVPPPDWNARHAQLSERGRALGLDLSVRLDELTAATAGWTGADLDRLVVRIAGGDVGGLLDVVAEVGSTASMWMERARVMVNFWHDRGMVDDLVGYLRRIGAA